MRTTMNNRLRVIAPLGVLVAAGLIAALLKLSQNPVERIPPEVPPPTVEVQRLSTEDVTLSVRTQGTVTARRESSLVAKVTGQLVWVSPNLVVGGVFQAGDRIAQIDPADYELSLTRAQARVAEAQQHRELIEAEAEQALIEWQSIGSGEPSALVARKPQLAEAEARLAAARADLQQAQLDLSRTNIIAPFRGRILSEQAEVGQWVTRGAILGRLFGIDIAEVRLPLTNRDIAKLDPVIQQLEIAPEQQPTVTLTGTIGDTDYQWSGRITRSEGTIDPQTRLLYIVTQVNNAQHTLDSDQPPLLTGLFVNAVIEGKSIRNVFRVPRQSLTQDRRVLIVDDNDRLRFRDIHIVQENPNDVIVDQGLTVGERLVVSRINAPVAGTSVQPTDLTAATQNTTSATADSGRGS